MSGAPPWRFPWEDAAATYEQLEEETKPSAFSNDLVVELSRRTASGEALGRASGHWDRQINVKGRQLLPVSSTKGTEDQLLCSFKDTDDRIHPVNERLRKEFVALESSRPPALEVLRLDTEMNRLPQLKSKAYHTWMQSFVAHGGLPMMVSLLLGPYLRSPWEPLLHLFFETLVYSHSMDLKPREDSQLLQVLAKSRIGTGSVLDLVLDHALRIKVLPISLTTQLATLLNFLVRLQEVEWVQKVVQRFLCEALLKPLVKVQQTPDKETEMKMHPELRSLLEYYKTPLKVLTTKASTKERLFVDGLVISILRNLKEYQGKVQFSPSSSPLRSSQDGESLTWSREDYEHYVFVLLDLLVTATSQSVTGRYLAWFLCFWNPHEHKNPPPFFFIHSLHDERDSFPLEMRRRLEATLCTLEFKFLRIREGLDSDTDVGRPVVRISIEEAKFNELLGALEAFPDEKFLLDITNENLFVPQMSLNYLSIGDYLRRNFVLAKINLSTSIWQSLQRTFRDNLHKVHSFQLANRPCTPHGSSGNFSVSIEVDRMEHLTFYDPSKAKKKSFGKNVDSASPVVFLAHLNPAGEVTSFLPAHYCCQSMMKGARRVTYHISQPKWDFLYNLKPSETSSHFPNHIFACNPALGASFRVHEAIHSLLRRATESKSLRSSSNGLPGKSQASVFPSWLEDLMSGKLSPSNLELSARRFSESHYWQAQSHLQWNFLGLFESPEIVIDFLNQLSSLSTKKQRGSHSPSALCESCALEVEEHQVEELPFEGVGESHWEESELSYRIALKCPRVDHMAPLQHTQSDSDLTANKSGAPVCWDAPKGGATLQLYPAQKEAILSALFRRFTIIIGPPGTGKTSVTTQIVRLLYHNFFLNTEHSERKKILLIAQSNNAVDQLVERIDPLGVPILRLGSQVTSEHAQKFTYDGHVERLQREIFDSVKALFEFADKRSSLQQTLENVLGALGSTSAEWDVEGASISHSSYQLALSKLQKWTGGIYKRELIRWNDRTTPLGESEEAEWLSRAFYQMGVLEDSQKRQIDTWERVQSLVDSLTHSLPILGQRSWAHRREAIFQSVAVVAATCSGLAMHIDIVEDFDTVIIEEAGKVLEAECLYAFSKHLKRIILVGDDQQMRSLVYDHRLKLHSELEQSLLTRMQRLGVQSIQLDQQTRARTEIANLYRWRYKDLKDHSIALSQSPLSLFKSGALYVDVKPTKSFHGEANPAECLQVIAFCRKLIANRVGPAEITILSPYKQQKALITKECASENLLIDVYTVDEFQGKENDVILLSLAFSGASPSAFLCDERRVNVMTSRSKRLFVLFANLQSLSSSPDWKKLIDMMSPLEQSYSSSLISEPLP